MKTNSSRTHLLPLVLAACCIVLLHGCKRNYEEFYFKATVAEAGLCSALQTMYILDVVGPKNIGDTLQLSPSFRVENGLFAYRSPRLLSIGETVYGVAYLTEGYAALNCIGLTTYKLPEMVLLSVDEDSNKVNQALKLSTTHK